MSGRGASSGCRRRHNPTLKTRVAAVKTERDTAQAAFDRAVSEMTPDAQITEARIAAFVALMRENVLTGDTASRRWPGAGQGGRRHTAGASLLNGALDVAIHVKRDDSGIIRGRLTKNRNGTCERDIAFRIAIEDGGVDEDGDQITLPRCEELNAAQAPEAVKMTPTERAVMDLIHTAGGEVTEADLRKLCIDGRKVSSSDNPDSRRRVTERALKGLVQKCAVIFEDGLYRIFDDSCDDFDDLGPDNPDSVRTNPGLSDMAKRRNPDGLGHTPLGVSDCPDDAGEGVL